MRDFVFENNGTRLYCTAWEEVTAPLGTILLVHDVGEYCHRYDDYAGFLNANGYYVVSMDLRGHGRTSGGYDHRGETEGEVFWDTVDDLHKLACLALVSYRTKMAAVGVGYGSTLLLGYMQKYGTQLVGAILSSCSRYRALPSLLGGIAVGTQAGFVDAHTPSNLVSRYIHNASDKPFASEKTRYAWLSRDKDVVKDYVSDPFCGAQFNPCLAFHQSLFKASLVLYGRNRMEKIPATLPILITAGEADPLADMGKRTADLVELMQSYGRRGVTLKLYAGARHDLLHEINRDQVYMDYLEYLDKCFGVQ
ncbi:MAG: alpha/beta hydrolase [Clostridia bacterium]|nr:alpha/beta hydrolase [Clostridia bacterium]